MRIKWLIILGLWFLGAGLVGAQSPAVWTTERIPQVVVTAGKAVQVVSGPLRSTAPTDNWLFARSVIAGPASGSAMVYELLSKPGNTGKSLLDHLLNKPLRAASESTTVKVARALPWESIAKGVGMAVPILGTALVIKELWDSVRCREGFGGGAECDAGTEEVTEGQWKYGPNVSALTFNSATAAANHNFSCGAGYTCQPYVCTQHSEGSVAVPEYGFVPGKVFHCTSGYSGPMSGTVEKYIQGALITSTKCPDVVIGGVTMTPTKGADGKCPTLDYDSATPGQVGDKVKNWGDKLKAVAAAERLINAGIPMDHPSPQITGPEVVPGGRETTQHPDGSTTTRDLEHPMTYEPDGTIRWEDRITERVWPSGTTPQPAGEPPPVDAPPPTITTTPGGTTTVDIETCGLPGTPPCKIDEGGTPPPPPPDAFGDWNWDPIRPIIDNPPVADTNWTWTFQLPSSCSVISVGSFAGREVSIDLCQYQPMIHDLVSMLWIGATFWFGIGFVGRALSN